MAPISPILEAFKNPKTCICMKEELPSSLSGLFIEYPLCQDEKERLSKLHVKHMVCMGKHMVCIVIHSMTMYLSVIAGTYIMTSNHLSTSTLYPEGGEMVTRDMSLLKPYIFPCYI